MIERARIPVFLRRIGAAVGSLFPTASNGEEYELPIGADGEVLTVIDGAPAWSPAVGAELLVEDGAAALLFDDTTSDVLYEG